jgi:hypothetical protein
LQKSATRSTIICGMVSTRARKRMRSNRPISSLTC